MDVKWNMDYVMSDLYVINDISKTYGRLRCHKSRVDF